MILDKPASAYNRTVQKQAANGDAESSEDSFSQDAKSTSRNRHESHDEFTPGELQDDDVAGQVAKISISHDGHYATAVCLAVEEAREGDVGGEAAAREP